MKEVIDYIRKWYINNYGDYADIYMEESIDAVEKALAPKTFYLWQNKIYHDKETLDDTLYEYYPSVSKSVDRIESLVECAYANTVDTVQLSFDELIQHLKDYKWEVK